MFDDFQVEGTKLIRYLGKRYEVVVPDGIQTISSRAFADCISIGEIKLPHHIKQINEFTFNNCTNLKKISLSIDLKRIGKHAFAGCESLGRLRIPSGVTKIERGAFWECSSLECIDLLSVENVDTDYLFASCYKLKDIKLPSNINNIGEGCFSCCYALKSVFLPETVLEIKDKAFWFCHGLLHITIPEKLKEIGKSAFIGCDNLEDVIFSADSHLNRIGSFAFKECRALKKIVLPPSLEFIDDFAFAVCDNLSEVYISNKTFYTAKTFIQCSPFLKIYKYDNPLDVFGIRTNEPNMQDVLWDNFVLENDVLKKYRGNELDIHIPRAITKIGKNAFSRYNKNAKIYLYGVYVIEESAFSNSVIDEIEFGDKLLTIERWAFWECNNLKKVCFPVTLREIGAHAFDKCVSLKTIIFNDGLTKIGIRAFQECKNIEYVIFPNALETIEHSAFYGCNSLKAVFVPKSVKRIDDFAFLSCEDAIIYFEDSRPKAEWSKYLGVNDSKKRWGTTRETFEIIHGFRTYTPTSFDDDDEFSFASEDYSPEEIFNSHGVIVEFGGVIVENGVAKLQFWFKNNSGTTRYFWIKSLSIDGFSIDSYIIIGDAPNDDEWYCETVDIDKIDLKGVNYIDFFLEVDDVEGNVLPMLPVVAIKIDFPNQEIDLNIY